MNFRILSLGLIFYAGYCSASELTVYRWVDKNNVVHFSQHQPIEDEYTEFLVSKQSKLKSRADAIISPVSSDKNIPTESSEDSLPSSLNMSKKCQDATKNLAMLKAFENIQYTDEFGKNQILNKQEKKLQLEINQKRTEVYCTREDDK
jgi:hypothetical protein